MDGCERILDEDVADTLAGAEIFGEDAGVLLPDIPGSCRRLSLLFMGLLFMEVIAGGLDRATQLKAVVGAGLWLGVRRA